MAKVYVARYSCGECGDGTYGVFSNEEAAQQACLDDSPHYGWVDECELRDTYITHKDRLRAERIARGADPETGKDLVKEA